MNDEGKGIGDKAQQQSLLQLIGGFHNIRNRYVYVFFIFFWAASYELCSFITMYTISELYQSLYAGNQRLFIFYLFISFLSITFQSGITAALKYSRDKCALQWREIIVSVLHLHLLSMGTNMEHLFTTSFVATSSPSSLPPSSISMKGVGERALTTIDQRITVDVESFCDSVASILEKILIVPFVIIFYSFWLGYTVDWMAPLLCLLFFLSGSFVCQRLSQAIVPLGYLQSQFEGNFRFYQLHFLQYLEQIILLGGGNCEHLQLSHRFQVVLHNKASLLWKEFVLNYGMNWFDYAGTTVSYLIVGLSILSRSSLDDSSSSDRVVVWSRGVYAAMTLIRSFSAIFDSSQHYALALAAKQRIEEFMNAFPIAKEEERATVSVEEDRSQDSRRWRAPLSWLPDRSDKREKSGEEEKLLLFSSEQNRWKSTSKPVSSIEVSDLSLAPSQRSCPFCQSKSSPASSSERGDCYLRLLKMDIYAKDQRKLLIKSLSLMCQRQMRLLVSGPTGCGKSTLLKTIAQLLKQQQQSYLFIPQTPYFLHQGSLWENLHYPDSFENLHSGSSLVEISRCRDKHYQRAKSVFEECQLQGFVHQLSLSESDTRESLDVDSLSQGEKQCLSVARILFRCHPEKNVVVLLDEVTSAVDEETEEKLYQSIVRNCSTIISVGHRSTIRSYHTHELILTKQGNYELKQLQE